MRFFLGKRTRFGRGHAYPRDAVSLGFSFQRPPGKRVSPLQSCPCAKRVPFLGVSTRYACSLAKRVPLPGVSSRMSLSWCPLMCADVNFWLRRFARNQPPS